MPPCRASSQPGILLHLGYKNKAIYSACLCTALGESIAVKMGIMPEREERHINLKMSLQMSNRAKSKLELDERPEGDA